MYEDKSIEIDMIIRFILNQASSSPLLFLPLFFFLEVRLGLLVSKGDNGARLIFFSDSVLTK